MHFKGTGMVAAISLSFSAVKTAVSLLPNSLKR